MIQSKKLIYYILYLLIYLGAVQKYVVSNQLLTIIPDIVIFVAYLFCLFGHTKRKKIKVLVGTFVCTIYILLLFSTILGAVLNVMNLASYLWGLRILLRNPLLFWIICQNFGIADVQKYKLIIYQGFYVNIAFCCYQFAVGETGDLMGGTFSDNGLLMLFFLIVFMIAVGDYYYKLIKPIRLYVILAGVMLVAIWAEIKIMYFLFPLVFYSLYVLLKKFSVKLFILLAFGFFFLIPTMKYFMSFYYDKEYVEQTFDSEFIEEETSHAYGFSDGGFNRSTAIDLTDKNLLDTPIKKTFGYGLGSGSISSLFSSGLFNTYSYTSYWNFSSSYCLTELGWSGFILYILFFIAIIARFFSIYLHTTNPEIKYWSSIGIVSGMVTFIIAWYNDNVYIKYLPVYFLWGICMVVIICKNKNKSIGKNTTV